VNWHTHLREAAAALDDIPFCAALQTVLLDHAGGASGDCGAALAEASAWLSGAHEALEAVGSDLRNAVGQAYDLVEQARDALP